MKTILLHIDGDPHLKGRLQAAMDLARANDAHITCLQVVNYEIFAPGDFYGSAMAAAIPGIKKAAEELREEVERDLANEDVIWEWRTVNGYAETKLLEYSALHDIIIVGPHELGWENSGPSILVGELALKAPVPVLVVPGEWKRLDLNAPIMVAWNGSAEASAALRAAVPIFSHGAKAILASVVEEKDSGRFDLPALDGAQYLSRYGVRAEIKEVPRAKARIANALFAAARDEGCGLMVMGAYGHSRLSEFLFGGVTRRALSDPQIPILLAH